MLTTQYIVTGGKIQHMSCLRWGLSHSIQKDGNMGIPPVLSNFCSHDKDLTSRFESAFRVQLLSCLISAPTET